MKKLLSFIGTLAFLLCGAMFTSCSIDEGVLPTLSTNAPAEIVFNADGTGGIAFIEITTNQTLWSYTMDPSDGGGWLTVNPVGNLLVFSARPNEFARDRSVGIKITAGDATPVAFTVKQGSPDAVLSVIPSLTELTFSTDGTVTLPGEAAPTDAPVFTVTTNIPEGWTVAVEPAYGTAGNDWLDISPATGIGGETFTLTAQSNINNYIARTAVTVRVTAGEFAPVKMTVKQDGDTPAIKSDDEGDYYEISRLCHLQWLSMVTGAGETLDAYRFVQTADIDMGSTPFTPIGTISNGFTGNYDGGGFTLSNLYIDLPDDDYVGLFGFVDHGSISNVGIASGSVKGKNRVGGVCGRNDFGTISACYNAGGVSGTDRVGGVSGSNIGTVSTCYNTGKVSGNKLVGGVSSTNDGTISSCYNAGEVSGNKLVGGVSSTNDGTISSCYNAGEVSGTERVGGVCGLAGLAGSISNCYNEGSVSGTERVGGVCGGTSNSMVSISVCYNTGPVSGTSYVGGVCGYNNSSITACYSTGAVTGNTIVGGVCGENAVRGITACYWLKRAENEPGIGGWVTDDDVSPFGTSSWPGVGIAPGGGTWADAGWGIYDGDGTTPPVEDSGKYWKSLGGWIAGGTPGGINSVRPKLWWEK